MTNLGELVRRPNLLSAAVAAAVLSTMSGVTGAASAATPPSPATHRGLAPAARGVTLVTGETVRVSTDAANRTIVQGVPATRRGPGAALQTVTSPRGTFVIPASARPYLNRTLDVNLFNVTALATAGADAQVPVKLGYSGTAVPKVPGVTVTSASAGVASGYLTPSSAKTFGAALAGQFTTDAKAHFPGRTTLFGASKISTGIAVPAPVTPRYPMRTLVIKLIDATGAPAPYGFVSVANTADFTKYVGFAFVSDGEARVSVPLGSYAVDAAFDRVDTAGNFLGWGVAVKNDYVVSGDLQSVTLDARTATSKLGVRTPKPADLSAEEFDVNRTDAAGTGSWSDGYALIGSGSIYVSPAPAPANGTLDTVAAWTLTGSPVTGTPYAYSLQFLDKGGIAASQAYSVATADLATFRSRLYLDGPYPRQGQMILFPMFAGSDFGGGWSFPVALPGTLDAYVNAIDGNWNSSLFAPLGWDNPFGGDIEDGPRLAPAGAVITADWGRGPNVPNVPFATDGYATSGYPFDCVSCRTAGKLQLGLAFATDSTPGHYLPIYGNADGTPVARLRVYRDAKLISDRPDTGYALLDVPATSSKYKIVDEVDRVPSGALQSLTTTTELTFVSAGSGGAAMPSSWNCSFAETTGDACTVLPLMTASVDLPTNLVGSVPLGTSSIGVVLGHIQGAATTAITSGKVEVRRPGGTWTALPTTAIGGGKYRAHLTTSDADAGTSLDLRVTGTDAAGGKIVQSAGVAFAVSSS